MEGIERTNVLSKFIGNNNFSPGGNSVHFRFVYIFYFELVLFPREDSRDALFRETRSGRKILQRNNSLIYVLRDALSLRRIVSAHPSRMAASYLKPEKERIPELIDEKRGGGVTYGR